ncbi:MAG: VanZ family protein [Fidelibacterota bacterium]
MNVNKFRVITIFYCLLILGLSSISTQSTLIAKWDKVIHFTEYAILGVLLQGSVEQRGIKVVLYIMLVGSLFAGVDELWQSMIPKRIPSFYDWIADTLGLLFGLSVSTFVTKKWKILKG